MDGIVYCVSTLAACVALYWLVWLIREFWWWGVRIRAYLRMDRIAAAHDLQRKPGESNEELARRIYHVNPSAVSVFEF